MLRQIPIKRVPNCTVTLVSGLIGLPQVKELKLPKCFSKPIEGGTCPFDLLCFQEDTQLTLQIPTVNFALQLKMKLCFTKCEMTTCYRVCAVRPPDA